MTCIIMRDSRILFDRFGKLLHQRRIHDEMDVVSDDEDSEDE